MQIFGKKRILIHSFDYKPTKLEIEMLLKVDIHILEEDLFDENDLNFGEPVDYFFTKSEYHSIVRP